jgi:hypothetical protein
MRLSPFHAAALIVILNAGSVSAHDWYSDLKGPEGQSCCNKGTVETLGVSS